MHSSGVGLEPALVRMLPETARVRANPHSSWQGAAVIAANLRTPSHKEVKLASSQDFYPLNLCETHAHSCSAAEQFCPQDGSKVVRKCLKCTQKLGEWRPMGSTPTGNVPQHCFNCGESFPWARRR